MGRIVHIYAAAQGERPSCSAAALQRRMMRMLTGLSSAVIPLPVCLPGCSPALVLYVCCRLVQDRIRGHGRRACVKSCSHVSRIYKTSWRMAGLPCNLYLCH